MPTSIWSASSRCFADDSWTFRHAVERSLLQKFPGHTILIRRAICRISCTSLSTERLNCLRAGTGARPRRLIRPVTTFILAAVIRDEVYLKSARTLNPTRILMIPAQAVRDVFGRMPHSRARLSTSWRTLSPRGARAEGQKLRTGSSGWRTGILEEIGSKAVIGTLYLFTTSALYPLD